LGSGCAKSELVNAILNKTENEIEAIASYFDYLEVQSVGNYQYLLSNNLVKNQDEIIEIIRKIITLGEKLDIPVVAVGNVHHVDQDEALNRKILIHNQQSGARYHHSKELYPAHYLNTEEMLAQFDFVDKKTAEKIVVKNPNKLNEQIESLRPFPNELHTPTIAGADEEITKLSYTNAENIYGSPLPEIISCRLERELSSIIKNGFSVIYLISHQLVAKSLADGYLVGSRGSVGSSFVATMTEITEVNPLPPHYICKNCKFSQFITDRSVGSGYDLPDKNCPKCNEKMSKDGHDIPFETFMGYKGDKVPDIDLNFSGEYQTRIHRQTEETFGEKKVFRAGTISTIADKTAFGYVRKYVEDNNLNLREAEISRLAKGCEGVKRTTGQHPGGQIVIPRDMAVTEFTPIQRPADDQNSEVITTHFDYHALSGTLLKLDLLGHDDPTALKMLEELTGVDPRSIPFDDPRLYQLFTSSEPLLLTTPLKDFRNGAIGVPEFGTRFVRQMLDETQPTTFAELVRISGLSHGTDVWRNNAQDLIKRGEANLSQVICTRDDITLYLISQGLDSAVAFSVSEKVRKGLGLAQADINEMRKHSVPAWYIESCQKIKYMFPKAHAVAYVQMALRIAYFKIYYPIYYYATYFTLRSSDFEINEITKGINGIMERINEINRKGNDASTKERDLLTALEVVQEMYHRGFSMENIDLYKSDSHRYTVNEQGDAIIPPFISISGVGLNLAKNIVKARKQAAFISVEDLQQRCKISKTITESLEKLGVLKKLNSTDQISLF
jgi:DNA polymerase-3 subunit alpha (Gram-positive type)